MRDWGSHLCYGLLGRYHSTSKQCSKDNPIFATRVIFLYLSSSSYLFLSFSFRQFIFPHQSDQMLYFERFATGRCLHPQAPVAIRPDFQKWAKQLFTHTFLHPIKTSLRRNLFGWSTMLVWIRCHIYVEGILSTTNFRWIFLNKTGRENWLMLHIKMLVWPRDLCGCLAALFPCCLGKLAGLEEDRVDLAKQAFWSQSHLFLDLLWQLPEMYYLIALVSQMVR